MPGRDPAGQAKHGDGWEGPTLPSPVQSLETAPLAPRASPLGSWAHTTERPSMFLRLLLLMCISQVLWLISLSPQ